MIHFESQTLLSTILLSFIVQNSTTLLWLIPFCVAFMVCNLIVSVSFLADTRKWVLSSAILHHVT